MFPASSLPKKDKCGELGSPIAFQFPPGKTFYENALPGGDIS
jgi:hypothetical protein